MPTPSYMFIEGKSQGKISEGANSEDSMGNKYQSEHTDEITVQEFRHELTIPRDPQSGQPSGPRIHGEFVVTKVFDKSSPKLYQALAQGERMNKVIVKWFRTSMTGQQEHYFTHELEDAVIVNINANMPSAQDPAMAHLTHMEEVAFSYRKITWTHEIAGTSGSDDWRIPA